MRAVRKRTAAAAAAFFAQTALFTALPLLRHAFGDPFASASFLLAFLPFRAFPALAFAAGFASCAAGGYSPALLPLTAAAFLPSAFIFYSDGASSFTLPLWRAIAVYCLAELAGMLTAFPIYVQRRLDISDAG